MYCRHNNSTLWAVNINRHRKYQNIYVIRSYGFVLKRIDKVPISLLDVMLECIIDNIARFLVWQSVRVLYLFYFPLSIVYKHFLVPLPLPNSQDVNFFLFNKFNCDLVWEFFLKLHKANLFVHALTNRGKTSWMDDDMVV